MTDDKIKDVWRKATGWDISNYPRTIEDVRKFAAIILAEEREACAEICDNEMDNAIHPGMKVAAGNCADTIRARG